MKFKGVIFDFDGLICDTEIAELESWQCVYSENGFIFPVEGYFNSIGSVCFWSSKPETKLT